MLLRKQKYKCFLFVASHWPRGGRRPCREIKRGPASADGCIDIASDLRHRATSERGRKATHGAGPRRLAREQAKRAVRSSEGGLRNGRHNPDCVGRAARRDWRRWQRAASGRRPSRSPRRRGRGVRRIWPTREGASGNAAGPAARGVSSARRGRRSSNYFCSALSGDGLSGSGGSRSLTYLPRRHCARVPSPWKSGAMPPSSWISARNTLLRGERALLA